MGIPVMKRCCCLELKWGALIAALVDWGLAGTLVGMTNSAAMWYVAVAVHVAHVVGCILVVASVFVPNKKLVMVYLITGIIRILLDIAFVIYLCIEFFENLLVAIIIGIIGLILAVYFWYVIFSWFKKLGGSAPVDI
ncbi:uncharacterized protein LOC108029761 isoform X2 [Drosophila biarmipes]|uniref:uncharacterized protein LOC108029761 isoform X2 n=1 Tax=Drosophila biarmipes TaxID=125945 RepID=UPI0007E65C96|nr:uncharacterized protein LOC108029761 isoform X2 [Drosophila biarmipes]